MDTTRAGYYKTFYDVASAINSTLHTSDVLATITRSAAEALDVKACSLMLLNPDRNELYHSSAFGLSEWYVRKGPLKVDLSLADALRGQVVRVREAGKDPRMQYRAQAVQEGIASVLCVPVRLRGEVIGVLRVYTAKPHDFSDDEIDFAEAIADLGAIALDNARRYEELQHDREAARQDLLEWFATWGLERSADALAGSEDAE
ncbi:MAG: GAF domain-containing protein [Chloroflexi bacterium]|nr:GAF domain-containing protein [Chloroflexota bacterium]